MPALAVVPAVSIELDGRDLAPESRRQLSELSVHQRLSAPSVAELTFALDARPGLPDGVEVGAACRIRIEERPGALFAGQVTALEYALSGDGARLLRVRAYDRLHALRKRQTVRSFADITVAELVRTLVADLEVDVEVLDGGPVWNRVAQFDQSDLELLVEECERCGLAFVLTDRTLRLMTLAGFGETVALEPGATLLESRLRVNADPACRTVSATGWDVGRATVDTQQASRPRTAREPVGEAAPDRVGGSGERTLLQMLATTPDQLAAAAQAELDQRVAAEVSLDALAAGDARLHPGARVEVVGVPAPFGGPYVLTRVTHRVDRRTGFTSAISSEPLPPRARPRPPVVSYGVVSRIDDPEGLGRVKVSLPPLGELETEWMAVLTAGAGRGKGMVALPDVGDHVLVVFPHGVPAAGVVLGALYGPETPFDTGIEGGQVARFTMATPGGQRAELDDSRRMVRLRTSDGSYVELSPLGLVVYATTDLTISAPGKAITIEAQTIDFARR